MGHSWREVDNLEAEYLYSNLQLKDRFLTEAAEKPSPTMKSFLQAQDLMKVLFYLCECCFETGTTKRVIFVYLLFENNRCFGVWPRHV